MHDIIELSVESALACPIGARWHQDWREYTLDTLRRVKPTLSDGTIIGTPRHLTPTWHVGPGDESLFTDPSPLTTCAHQHTAFKVRGHVVHIDMIRATGSGPGFSLRAALIHVDGIFRGRAWICGQLGGNGNSFPARGRIDDRSSLTVEFEPGKGSALPDTWITVAEDETVGRRL